MACLKILAYFLEIGPIKEKPPNRRCILKAIWASSPISFFDDASTSKVCGSGMFIVIKPRDYHHFRWFSGKGSNNRAELLALWGVLLCANWLAIDEIVVFGDSK